MNVRVMEAGSQPTAPFVFLGMSTSRVCSEILQERGKSTDDSPSTQHSFEQPREVVREGHRCASRGHWGGPAHEFNRVSEKALHNRRGKSGPDEPFGDRSFLGLEG